MCECIQKFTDKNRFLLVFACRCSSDRSDFDSRIFPNLYSHALLDVRLFLFCLHARKISMRALESECECVCVTVRESEFRFPSHFYNFKSHRFTLENRIAQLGISHILHNDSRCTHGKE